MKHLANTTATLWTFNATTRMSWRRSGIIIMLRGRYKAAISTPQTPLREIRIARQRVSCTDSKAIQWTRVK